jgi:hypothetical protein
MPCQLHLNLCTARALTSAVGITCGAKRGSPTRPTPRLVSTTTSGCLTGSGQDRGGTVANAQTQNSPGACWPSTLMKLTTLSSAVTLTIPKPSPTSTRHSCNHVLKASRDELQQRTWPGALTQLLRVTAPTAEPCCPVLRKVVDQ